MKKYIVFSRKMTLGEINIRIKHGQVLTCPICGGAMKVFSFPGNDELPNSPMGIFCSIDANHDPVVTGYPSTSKDVSFIRELTKMKSSD